MKTTLAGRSRTDIQAKDDDDDECRRARTDTNIERQVELNRKESRDLWSERQTISESCRGLTS